MYTFIFWVERCLYCIKKSWTQWIKIFFFYIISFIYCWFHSLPIQELYTFLVSMPTWIYILQLTHRYNYTSYIHLFWQTLNTNIDISYVMVETDYNIYPNLVPYPFHRRKRPKQTETFWTRINYFHKNHRLHVFLWVFCDFYFTTIFICLNNENIVLFIFFLYIEIACWNMYLFQEILFTMVHLW